ncbi:MAG: fibronectin type III-like domain-contianing protein [Spirochaetia bacterium]|nr:fibronectin type III-like domain-contianing protein [Spirochaetia bacterium]
MVQLYVSELTGTHEDRPVKELKAFTKVQLNPKESKVVTMTLDKRSFAFWNTEIGDWYAPTGEYLISAGASCTDIRLKAKVNVTSKKVFSKLMKIQFLRKCLNIRLQQNVQNHLLKALWMKCLVIEVKAKRNQ